MQWLDRFIEIMDRISEANVDGIGISELARDTGLSKGTLHRMLSDMAEQKLLTQVDATKKYQLGPKAMVWGSHFVSGQDPAGLMAQYCDFLSRTTKLYTYLCRFVAGEVYCVYTRQPEQERTKYYVHVGQRMPLHCAAAAKAILAFQPRAEARILLKKNQCDLYTDRTKMKLQDQLEELDAVQVTKIAFCTEELELGVAAISTPVFFRSNEGAVFSLSLVGAAEYIAENRTSLVRQLLQVGDKAGQHLRTISLLGSPSGYEPI